MVRRTTNLDELERRDGRQPLVLWVIEAAGRMGGVVGRHAVDDARRLGGPVRGGEGEAVVGAGVEGVEFDGHRVDPRAADAQLNSSHAI